MDHTVSFGQFMITNNYLFPSFDNSFNPRLSELYKSQRLNRISIFNLEVRLLDDRTFIVSLTD